MRLCTFYALPESLCQKFHLIDSVLKDVRSVLVNNDISGALISLFKHVNSLSQTVFLIQLMRPAFETITSNDIRVIPVSLPKSRQVSQRLNQAAKLARNP